MSLPPKFEKTNQHVVPCFWQRGFADASGVLYGRDRKGQIKPISVTKTMTEDWTYTVFDKWWRPSDEVEDALAKIEGKASLVFAELHDVSKPVTPELRKQFAYSLGVAACRTPPVMRRAHMLGKQYGRALAQVHDLPEDDFHRSIFDRFGINISGNEYIALRARSREQLAAEAAELESMSPQDPRLPEQWALLAAAEVSKVIELMDVHLVATTPPNYFVLGDTPLPDENIGTGFTVPLSKELAARVRPSGFPMVLRTTGDQTEVAAINAEQYARAADLVIGPNRAVLANLA